MDFLQSLLKAFFHQRCYSLMCLLIGLIGLIGLSSATAASAIDVNHSIDHLRIGLSSDVTSIDPHANNSGPNVALSLHIFEPLIATNAQGRLVPGLAASWRVVDPLTWEIKLRGGVKFHDGSDLTAEDVVFSLERPNTLAHVGAPFTQFVRAIVAKQIVDARTIRLKTALPYVLLPYDLNTILIVSKKAAENAASSDFDRGKAAIGTGPFKLVSYKRSDRIELAKNTHYWGTQALWDKVTLRLIASDPARLAALLSGEVDAIENIPTADYHKLSQNPHFKIDQRTSWRTIFWHLDQHHDQSRYLTDKQGRPLPRNPFKDQRVRLALSKAIHRDAIVTRIMEGLAVPAANLVSPGIFGHNSALKPERYDPQGAKKLLAQAGYPEGFALTLHAPNNRYVNDDQIAQAVAGMLTRVGIQTKVETLPWSTYLPKAHAGEYALCMIGWGSLLGDNTLKSHVATTNAAKGYGSYNFGGYSNPQIDQMLDQNFTLFDEAARQRSAQTIMAQAMQQVLVIPLHHQLASWAMRKGITYPGRVDEFTLAQEFVRH